MVHKQIPLTEYLNRSRDDPVFFAKNVLKLPLHSGQKQILSCKDRFISIKAGRRWGKTYCFSVFAAWMASTNNDCRIVCLAPSQRQADELFQAIDLIISNSILNECVVRRTLSKVQLNNKSVIESVPGRNPDALRGYSINLLLCDESAYISPAMFNSIYATVANVGKKTIGKLVLISTPRFKAGEFYNSFQPGSMYKTFEMSYDDAINEDGTRHMPDSELEMFAQLCGGRDTALFKREYLADWGEASDSFFDEDGVEQSLVRDLPQIKYGLQGHKYAIGVDLALSQDYTVFATIDYTDKKQLKIVNVERFTGKSTDQIMDRLYQKAVAFHPTQILIDDAKIGASVVSHMKTGYPGYNWKAFNFNTTSKVPLMTDLNIAMSTNIIEIPDDDQIREELLSFYYEENQNTGHLKLNGVGAHDDCVIAIGLSLRAANVFTKRDDYFIGSSNGILQPKKIVTGPPKYSKVLYY